MTRRHEALAVAAALTAVAGVLLVAALRLPRTAAAVPVAVAVPTLALLLDLLRKEARHPNQGPGRTEASDAGASRLPHREAATIAWMVLLLALLWLLGAGSALPLYLLLHLRWRSGESWWASVATAVGAWLLLYVVLELLLRVAHRPGALESWFVGT